MPGIDGIELFKRIRNAKFPYDIYIMIMSSKSHKTEMITVIKEGADDITIVGFKWLGCRVN